MNEHFSHVEDFEALAIVLAVSVTFCAALIWVISKIVHRSYLDLVRLVAGAVVLVATTLLMLLVFRSYGRPSIEQRWLVHQVEGFIFLGAATLIVLAFNRRTKRRSRSGGRSQPKTTHTAS